MFPTDSLLPSAPLRRRSAAVVGILSAALLTACGGGGGGAGDGGDAPASDADPFAGREQFAYSAPRLAAAVKQAQGDGDTQAAEILEQIDQTPSGIWLNSENYPTGQVGTFVDSVIQSAGEQLPVFVIYGIPDRDCTGEESSGGLTNDTYLPWVDEISTAIGGDAVAVLEPDALVSSGECGGEQRLSLLAGAVDTLDKAGVTTYVDAGHSSWVPPEQVAPLLQQVGVDQVRGFATNVANYQPDQAELDYATTLNDQLGGDSHYVIDTGRNGDPDGAGDAVEDWCNPSDQSLGDRPGPVADGGALDARLWIKPPAESDGTCNGGPAAGEVWVERAVALGEAAGL